MVQCTSYKEGILAPGNGPSFAERKRRQHARQLQKAKRIGKEMFEDSENGHVIDPFIFLSATKKQETERKTIRR